MGIEFTTYQRWFESCEPQFPYVYHKVYGNKGLTGLVEIKLDHLGAVKSISVMLDEYTRIVGCLIEDDYRHDVGYFNATAGWPPHIPRRGPPPATDLAPPVPQGPVDYMGITRAVIGRGP